MDTVGALPPAPPPQHPSLHATGWGHLGLLPRAFSRRQSRWVKTAGGEGATEFLLRKQVSANRSVGSEESFPDSALRLGDILHAVSQGSTAGLSPRDRVGGGSLDNTHLTGSFPALPRLRLS